MTKRGTTKKRGDTLQHIIVATRHGHKRRQVDLFFLHTPRLHSFGSSTAGATVDMNQSPAERNVSCGISMVVIASATPSSRSDIHDSSQTVLRTF